MDRMTGAGWLTWLAFRVSVNPNEADELTVGPVWGPGVVEELSVENSAATVFLRAWAVASRGPLTQGLALDEVVPQGTLLTEVATDTALESRRTGLEFTLAWARNVAIGVTVPWAGWWVRVRVESLAAGVALVSGQFKVRVFDREHLWGEMAAGQRGLEQRARVGYVEGGPDGLVAGYRSWV